jgi:hypothetical protein
MPKVSSSILMRRQEATTSSRSRRWQGQQGKPSLGSGARVISFDGYRSSSSLSCCSDDDSSSSSSGLKMQSGPLSSMSSFSPRSTTGSLMRSRKRGQSSNLCSLASLNAADTGSTASFSLEEEQASEKKSKTFDSDHSDSESEAWGQFVDVIPPEESLNLFNQTAVSCLSPNDLGANRPMGRRRSAGHPYLTGLNHVSHTKPKSEQHELRMSLVRRTLVSPTLSVSLGHLHKSQCFSLDEEASCSFLEHTMKRMNV